jgi:hypothetical protein
VIVEPDKAKVEQALLPRFAQLNRSTTTGFYTRYSPGELTVLRDFLSRLIGS